MKHVDKPPDNAFSRVIAFLSIVLIYVAVIGYRFWQFKHLQRASLKTSKPSRIAMASSQSLTKPAQMKRQVTLSIPMGYPLSLTTLLLA